MTISVQMVAGENLNIAIKFFKASVECLLHPAVDHFIVGLHPRMSEEGREFLKKCDWVDDTIELKGGDFSEWRNEVLEASPVTDYILKVDADETYFPECLDGLKVAADEGVREVVFVNIDHLMVTPHQKQDVGHIPVLFNSGPKWGKKVHECFRVPAESDSAVVDGPGFVHWGYVKPQLSTFLKWAHYDLLEHGSLHNYKVEQTEDGQVPWFRDWRNPHTILNDRLEVCKPHTGFPEDAIYIIESFLLDTMGKEATWEEWQRDVDPDLFEWYDNIRDQVNGDLVEFVTLLENKENWPEAW